MLMTACGDDDPFPNQYDTGHFDMQNGTIWGARSRGYQCSGGPQS